MESKICILTDLNYCILGTSLTVSHFSFKTKYFYGIQGEIIKINLHKLQSFIKEVLY